MDGIDAYLVEVAVDVGSAAIKDCGFEFPYRQGVTINLAPADARKVRRSICRWRCG